MRAIFVSYRRDDSEGEAGRLFDELVSHFGEPSVFMDVAAIAAGRDFRKAIDESVATCGVLLSIIGKDWVNAKNEAGQRRLDDPSDFVRLETASALKRDIPVVPVLVHGAKMPHPEQLPDDLKELTYRNGVELTHARWSSDVQLLIKALHPYIDEPKSADSSPIEALAKAGEVRRTSPTQWKNSLRMILSFVATVLVVGVVVAYMILSRKTTVRDLSSAKGVAIMNAHSGLCLSPAGGGRDNNNQIVQFTCDQDPSRFWSFTVVNGDIVEIMNLNSGLCLTIAGGNTERNVVSVQYTCDHDPSRRWRYTVVDATTFRLVNLHSGLCLTIAGGGTDRNTAAVQYPCDGDRSRDWKISSRL